MPLWYDEVEGSERRIEQCGDTCFKSKSLKDEEKDRTSGVSEPQRYVEQVHLVVVGFLPH